jgi:hypothetical protein
MIDAEVRLSMASLDRAIGTATMLLDGSVSLPGGPQAVFAADEDVAKRLTCIQVARRVRPDLWPELERNPTRIRHAPEGEG